MRTKAIATLAMTGVVMAGALTAGAATKPPALSWLRVEHPVGALAQVVDAQGRTVILRGVNVVGIEDDFYRDADGSSAGPTPFWPESPSAYANGRCPTNSNRSAQPPICERDLAQVKSFGFNVIRLPVSWSRIEPQPGRINQTYVDRVAQVVGWAKAQGIYTIIDMHEDSYSRFTPEDAPINLPGGIITAAKQGANHADGAPPWAVVANGIPAETIDGTAELNAFVESAFTSFWLDLTPPGVQGSLQEHYLAAMGALMKRFKSEPAVAGYELMNEPLPGFIAPGAIDQGFLYPFYKRVVDTMTAAVGDSRHLVFFEPIVLRNLTDFAVGASRPWTTYPNLVYAPHVYTHVFTADTFLPAPASTVLGAVYPLGYGQAMQTATAEAKAMKAALFIGEYGNDASIDDTQLAAQTAEFDKTGVGTALWQWKSNGSSWSMYKGSSPIASRVKYVARAYPLAVAGQLKSFGYDPVRRSFILTASADRAGVTEIYVPPAMTGTGKGRVLRYPVKGGGDYVIAISVPAGRSRS